MCRCVNPPLPHLQRRHTPSATAPPCSPPSPYPQPATSQSQHTRTNRLLRSFFLPLPSRPPSRIVHGGRCQMSQPSIFTTAEMGADHAASYALPGSVPDRSAVAAPPSTSPSTPVASSTSSAISPGLIPQLTRALSAIASGGANVFWNVNTAAVSSREFELAHQQTQNRRREDEGREEEEQRNEDAVVNFWEQQPPDGAFKLSRQGSGLSMAEQKDGGLAVEEVEEVTTASSQTPSKAVGPVPVTVRTQSLGGKGAVVAPTTNPGLSRAATLKLASIEDEDIRRLLDPNSSPTEPLDIASWPDEKVAALIAAIEPQHLPGLMRKSSPLSAKESATSISFQGLSYVEQGQVRLSSISGYILPGMLIGVLGAPDAGVTTFLNVLTGRQKGGKVYGEVLVNGKPPSAGFERTVGYVVKDDLNLSTMTVAETLMFSALLRQPYQPRQLIKLRVAVVLKMLGLAHTANTLIGDGIVRGISGGEKRRVSYACEIVAGHQVVVADLPTNGLDSASAFNLLSNVKYANRAGRSMIASLVQPSPELFALLDFVLLLSKGAALFFGPASHVQDFLRSQGFEQTHAGRSLPEFLEELSAQPEKFWVNRSIPRQPAIKSKFAPQNWTPPLEAQSSVTSQRALLPASTSGQTVVAITADAAPQGAMLNQDRLAAWKRLVQGFKESEYCQDVGAVLFKQSSEVVILPTAPQSWLYTVATVLRLQWLLGDGSYKYNSSFLEQVAQCLRRQAMLTFRSRALWFGSWVKSIVIGLIIGSLFYQIGNGQADTRTRFGLYYFMLSFNGNGAVQMVSVLLGSRPVYYNQVNAGYFNGVAYYLATIAVQIPIAIVESFLFIVIVYPMSGLYGGVGSEYFLYTWCMLLLVNLVARSWVLLLSCLSPTQEIASILTPISNVLFSVFSGYLAPKSSIPTGWQWLYYISYYTYAIRGMAINGIYYLTFTCPAGATCQVNTGEEDLALYDMDGSFDERWTDMENLVWFFIAFNAGAAFFMIYLNFARQDAAEPPSFLDDSSALREKEQRSLPPGVSSAEMLSQPKAYLEWKQLVYSVPVKKEGGRRGETVERVLLNKTFGYCKPRIMVALMGASGAGKSTLLDVLAGKKTEGTIKGDILVNGRPRDPLSFSRIAGYVEQFDNLVPEATVRESVEFSAELRLPAHVSAADRRRKVDNVLAVLGLTHLQHESIGSSETGGVSPEVRKKTTIAVELIMEPSLLFLDEPTTGLDGVGASAVMTAVRELAREISVMCTIHQPSAEIVHMFDVLCLLKSGGEVAYFGPIDDVAQYLDNSGFGRCPPERNIADFALEAVKFAGSGKNYRGDNISLSQAFLDSPNAQPVLATLEAGLVSEEERARIPPVDLHDRASSLTQFKVLTVRFWNSTIRRRSALFARYFVPIFMGFLIGTLFFQLGDGPIDASNRVSIMFLSLLFAIFSAGSQLPAVFQMRPIYFREHNSDMYGPGPYFLGRFVADVPFVLSEMLIYSIMVYFLAGLTTAGAGIHFFLFLLCFWGSRWVGIAFTQLCGTVFATIEAANGLQAAILTVFMLFCGFLISKGSIPSGWIWMYYLSFIRYPLDFLIANEVLNLDFTCDDDQVITQPFEPNLCPDTVTVFPAPGYARKCPIACGKDLLSQFQIDYGDSDIALNLGLVFVWLAGFLALGYLALRYVNHIKR